MKHIPDLAKSLSSLPLFSKTSPETLTVWLQDCNAEVTRVATGESMDREHQRTLGILLDGKAEIQSADSGRNVILRTLCAPGVFGAAALFCREDAPLSRIEAKSPCLVLYLTTEDVRILLSRDEPFRDAYLTFLAERVRFLNRKILCFTAGSAERRLALWLISEESNNITLPASLTALADTLDIGRASLYRAMDRLEEEGLIRRCGREITVISQENILKKYQ
ncbi:MAG: Crp/Fnr family transcriptional regulator [Clostridia bacterium]|nr:Crp/Fnr family transcriptional regulator [Clostridia bacterium]